MAHPLPFSQMRARHLLLLMIYSLTPKASVLPLSKHSSRLMFLLNN
jgi:hypothetical protein